jgi:hypothetical protein
LSIYGLKFVSQNRVQWVSGVGQYIKADLLDKAEKGVTTDIPPATISTPAKAKVYGEKDRGSLNTVSGSDA